MKFCYYNFWRINLLIAATFYSISLSKPVYVGWSVLSPPCFIKYQDCILILHKTAEPVQTSRLGVSTVSKPFTMKAPTSFSPASAVLLSKMWGLKVNATPDTVLCVIYSVLLFIEQQLKNKERRAAVCVGGKNICPFKGLSSLVCSVSTPWVSESWHTSQNKAEEEGEWRTSSKSSLPYQQIQCMFAEKSPDSRHVGFTQRAAFLSVRAEKKVALKNKIKPN